MKKKPYLSRHRGICILSGVCLLVPVLINCLRAQGSPTPACVSAALLCGCAVLLLLPLADERIDVSLRFALAIVAVCAAGSLLDAAERKPDYVLPSVKELYEMLQGTEKGL